MVEYTPYIVQHFEQIAQQAAISYDSKEGHWLVAQFGNTMRCVKGIKGTYIGLPISPYHAHNEVVNTQCVTNMVNFLSLLAKETI